MITKIKLGTILLLIIFAISLILSNYVTPDYGLIFNLKRFQEKGFLNVKSSFAEKADFTSLLLDERLSELKYLVENQRIGYILSSSLRYSATAGMLTELIKENKLLGKTPAVKEQFISHQKILERLVGLCRINDNTECKYIQDDINYLKIYNEVF